MRNKTPTPEQLDRAYRGRARRGVARDLFWAIAYGLIAAFVVTLVVYALVLLDDNPGWPPW